MSFAHWSSERPLEEVLGSTLCRNTRVTNTSRKTGPFIGHLRCPFLVARRLPRPLTDSPRRFGSRLCSSPMPGCRTPEETTCGPIPTEPAPERSPSRRVSIRTRRSIAWGNVRCRPGARSAMAARREQVAVETAAVAGRSRCSVSTMKARWRRWPDQHFRRRFRYRLRQHGGAARHAVRRDRGPHRAHYQGRVAHHLVRHRWLLMTRFWHRGCIAAAETILICAWSEAQSSSVQPSWRMGAERHRGSHPAWRRCRDVRGPCRN